MSAMDAFEAPLDAREGPLGHVDGVVQHLCVAVPLDFVFGDDLNRAASLSTEAPPTCSAPCSRQAVDDLVDVDSVDSHPCSGFAGSSTRRPRCPS